jgi:hypothetical protein
METIIGGRGFAGAPASEGQCSMLNSDTTESSVVPLDRIRIIYVDLFLIVGELHHLGCISDRNKQRCSRPWQFVQRVPNITKYTVQPAPAGEFERHLECDGSLTSQRSIGFLKIQS